MKTFDMQINKITHKNDKEGGKVLCNVASLVDKKGGIEASYDCQLLTDIRFKFKCMVRRINY